MSGAAQSPEAPAVAKKGFTERQARFLTIVMLHAGLHPAMSNESKACR
jgi:hypothetical protein